MLGYKIMSSCETIYLIALGEKRKIALVFYMIKERGWEKKR